MPYTLGEAAKATGKSKATISESIAKGRISAIKNDLGRYEIDPAELHRVYPPISKAAPINEQEQTPNQTALNTEEAAKIRELEAKVQMLERLCAEMKEEKKQTREEAAEWRRTITALLLPPQEEKKPEPRPVTVWEMFWPFGRRA